MISIDKELCINCGRCVESCSMGVFRRDESGAAEVGREKRCIRCMHCAAACPRKAVVFEGLRAEELYPAPGVDEVLRLVETRRSIRRYQAQPPRREILQGALDGAGYAPSAKNQRVCRWTVLYGKERTDKAAELALEWAAETRKSPELVAMGRAGANLITCGAPCVILCHAPREAEAMLDAGIATTTLELLLSRAGLGTCWAGFFSHISDQAPALRTWLGLPEGDQVCCGLMVGYPDGDDYPNVPYRAAGATDWLTERMDRIP